VTGLEWEKVLSRSCFRDRKTASSNHIEKHGLAQCHMPLETTTNRIFFYQTQL